MEQLKVKLAEEIKLRGLSARTQEVYTQVVIKFITFSKKPYSTIDLEDVKKYKLHLINSKKAPSTTNKEMAALKFFYPCTPGSLG